MPSRITAIPPDDGASVSGEKPKRLLFKKKCISRVLSFRKGRQTRRTITTSIRPTATTNLRSSGNTNVTLAFVNSLDGTQLSNFLAWVLYFEVVELPEPPASWFKYIDAMDIRGWIALGIFISENQKGDLEADLMTLHAICDRLHLNRSVVHACLVQFSSPKGMAFTQMGTIVHTQVINQPSLEILDRLQGKLHDFFDLAIHIQPTEGSIYENWKDEVVTRVRMYLAQVIAPRIKLLKMGTPLPTNSTNKEAPKDIKSALRLSYLFEAMLLEREVPSAWWGVFSDRPRSVGYGPLNDADATPSPALDENHFLRREIAKLRKENEALIAAKQKLARELATLGRGHPAQ